MGQGPCEATLIAEFRPVVSSQGNRFQSELELMGFSQKSGKSIVEQSGSSRGPDVGREIHIG